MFGQSLQEINLAMDREGEEVRNGGDGRYLFVDGAVVVGGGDVIFLGVKQALLVVQQLRQHSADRLLVPKVLSFS